MAAGQDHSVFLRGDGTVWAAGSNQYGQLGDGTTTDRNVPVQVTSLSGTYTAVAAGQYFSVALKSDGTVWAWGQNTYGQLGNNTTTNSSTPVEVIGSGGTGYLGSITAIAAGGHVLALQSGGNVWEWGRGVSGEAGNGSTVNHSLPVQTTISSVTAIAAGDYHSLAVKSNGSVWAWGYNGSGQIGDNTTTERDSPVQVSGLSSSMTAVAAGQEFSHTLKSDGTRDRAIGRLTGLRLGEKR